MSHTNLTIAVLKAMFVGEVGGEEGMVRGGRFNREDVESGPGELVTAQGPGEGVIVDQGPTAHVEEKGTGFHGCEGLVVD